MSQLFIHFCRVLKMKVNVWNISSNTPHFFPVNNLLIKFTKKKKDFCKLFKKKWLYVYFCLLLFVVVYVHIVLVVVVFGVVILNSIIFIIIIIRLGANTVKVPAPQKHKKKNLKEKIWKKILKKLYYFFLSHCFAFLGKWSPTRCLHSTMFQNAGGATIAHTDSTCRLSEILQIWKIKFICFQQFSSLMWSCDILIRWLG